MTKINMILAGVVVVGVVAGGWYVLGNKTSAPVASDNSSPTTMRELLASSASLECSFSETDAQASTVGTVFVADGLVRGDLIVEAKAVAGQKIESHVLIDGKKVWVWSSALPNGLEMTIDPTVMGDQANGRQVDFDKKMNYECKPWVKDMSKFERPTDIQFMPLPTAPVVTP